MIIAISDSLSDLAMSDNGEDGEPQGEEVAERGKLTEDDEPGWVMGTIAIRVQQHVERLQQVNMMLEGLTQHGF